MAIKELFYDNRPRVLLDPRASQRIDPRFTFTRDSTGTFIDKDGLLKTAAVDEPRFNYDPETGECSGLLLEKSVINVRRSSNDFNNSTYWFQATQVTMTPGYPSPNGGTDAYLYRQIAPCNNNQSRWGPKAVAGSVPKGQYIYSFFCKLKDSATENIVGFRFSTASYSYRPATSKTFLGIQFTFDSSGVPTSQDREYGGYKHVGDGWYRVWMYVYSDSVSGLDGSSMSLSVGNEILAAPATYGSFYIYGVQLETTDTANYEPTSYIPTTSTAVTRAQDLLSVEAPLPATGSVYIDARALAPVENDTLLSLKNDSNNKIDLAYLSNTATYDSLALIASYDGASKASLPLPVPTTDRERNIITYGANNYQYGRDSSRFATSLSSSVPTDLNKLSIGHDAVDPTKAFNSYINTVYAWSGELTPEVAEALVRGEIDAIDADNYNPTGPAGSLALVINTQGATAGGEKTFTLPAESDATDNDIVVTWGDGTESGLSNTAAELGAIGLTHQYPAAGIYPVWVEGKMQNIQYNNISNADDLLLIAEWGTGDMLTAPSTMRRAFYGCSQMDFSNSARNTNLPDTSAVEDWRDAFRDCSSITGTFPSFDFTAATSFSFTWYGCSNMTSVPAIFIADGSVTQNVTDLNSAWAWCGSLTSFPLINTSEVTTFSNAWFRCTGLTSFPSINTAKATNFAYAWNTCSSLTSFPLINTSLAQNLISTWAGCANITSFPLIDTSGVTNFNASWSNCSSLTSFPLIDTSSGTNFTNTWAGLEVTSFPLIDTSSGTTFNSGWLGCVNLTSFPLIDTSLGTDFEATWLNCGSLTDFPASFFDSWAGTPGNKCFYRTWGNCTSLTATSVDNILVSIAASGVSAPSGTDTNDKKITIDYDGTTLPGTTATAITTLKSRNWDIYLNGVQQ